MRRKMHDVTRIEVLVALGLGLATLAACTSTGPGLQDNPVTRKFTWFSYVKGDDVRARCQPGAPDAYRFVYNAVYVEQVRTYDIAPSPMPGHMRMTARVTEKANLASMDVGAPSDLLDPWRPKSAVIDLPQAEVDRLKRALLADGFLTKAPPSRALTSIEFYWAVSACIDGQFRLNAYVWPGTEFEQASFPKLLFGWDMTEVRVNPPRPTDAFSVYGRSMPEHSEFANFFRLRFDDRS
jgi:hypothetical protein